MVILYNGRTYIRQRLGKDIWEQLYEFPMIETGKALSFPGLAKLSKWSELFEGQEIQVLKTSSNYKHQLTHQEINARFYMLVPLELRSFSLPDSIRIRADELADFPLPTLIARTMKELGWIEGKDLFL